MHNLCTFTLNLALSPGSSLALAGRDLETIEVITVTFMAISISAKLLLWYVWNYYEYTQGMIMWVIVLLNQPLCTNCKVIA